MEAKNLISIQRIDPIAVKILDKVGFFWKRDLLGNSHGPLQLQQWDEKLGEDRHRWGHVHIPEVPEVFFLIVFAERTNHSTR